MSATLEKALRLIEAMSTARTPCGVTQLAKDLRFNKSTVHRLLDTLAKHGYVRQEHERERYVLTTKLWELGVDVLHHLELHAVARPFLEQAVEDTGEEILLAILEGRTAVIIDKVDSPQALQIFTPLGGRVFLHCSSLGKALIAEMPDEVIADITHPLSRRTDHTITDLDRLMGELARVRERGYAVSTDEWQIGVSGFGAAIRDVTGAVVGSVGITLPSSRLTEDRVAPLGQKTVEVAREISRAMGYRGAAEPDSRTMASAATTP